MAEPWPTTEHLYYRADSPCGGYAIACSTRWAMNPVRFAAELFTNGATFCLAAPGLDGQPWASVAGSKEATA